MFSSFRFNIIGIQCINKRFAGHSKWQNIRHTKAAKDLERSRLFIRLGQKIKIAVKENGSDPNLNVKLQQAIDVAKLKNMPNATIQNCIKQAKNDGDKTKLFYIDLKGPKGVFLIVEVMTPYVVKVKNDVTGVAKRFNLSVENNLRNNFSHKGVIVAKPNSEIKDVQEASVDHAIESGAEDVYFDEEENLYKFICNPNDIRNVSEKLTTIGYLIEEADDHLLPLKTVALEDIYVDKLSKVVERINQIDGVLKVYDNIV